jgi:hypothetical protein
MRQIEKKINPKIEKKAVFFTGFSYFKCHTL